jgi:hypothetical protein
VTAAAIRRVVALGETDSGGAWRPAPVPRIKLFLDAAFAATPTIAGPQLVRPLDEKLLIGLLIQDRASLTVPNRPPDQEGLGPRPMITSHMVQARSSLS